MSLSTGKCISLPLLFHLDARLASAAKRKEYAGAAKAKQPDVAATTLV